jgi:hypothetical protein
MGSYSDYRQNIWAPREATELEPLFALFRRHGHRVRSPRIHKGRVIAEFPFFLNLWPFRVPNFHIPLRDGLEDRFRALNAQILDCARRKEIPPRAVAQAVVECVDDRQQTTARVARFLQRLQGSKRFRRLW